MQNIYRYLATANALILLTAMGLITWVYNYQATRDLIYMAVERSIALDRILSNTIWARYDDYLSAASRMNAETLRSRPETAEIRAAISMATEGVRILKAKIYSTDGLILFSSDPQEIGGDYSDSQAFRTAADEGLSSSELSYKGRLTAFSGEVFDRDVVETYLPWFDAEGRVTGVVELYTDVTEIKKRIDLTTIRLIAVLTVVFLTVYAVLVAGVLRRAIGPIQLASSRAAEIGPGASGVRLPTAGMPRDILPLIEAVNGAIARLDRALDAQRRFTANAAHQLMTPLAVLRAHIDALENKSLTEPVRRDIDAMTEMVRQLLELAELEAASQSVDLLEATDLHAVAVEAISLLAPRAIREGRELALSSAPSPILVRGSASLLNQVLRNLIENALRHAPRNTTVEVELRSNGIVRVIDRGEGVPPDKREQIFERFWRGGNDAEGGAGLGLSIVKQIVEAIGGRVWLEDTPTGGACFSVQFAPAGHAEPAASDGTRLAGG